MIDKTNMKIAIGDLEHIRFRIQILKICNSSGLSKPEKEHLAKIDQEIKTLLSNMLLKYECIFKDDLESSD